MPAVARQQRHRIDHDEATDAIGPAWASIRATPSPVVDRERVLADLHPLQETGEEARETMHRVIEPLRVGPGGAAPAGRSRARAGPRMCSRIGSQSSEWVGFPWTRRPAALSRAAAGRRWRRRRRRRSRSRSEGARSGRQYPRDLAAAKQQGDLDPGRALAARRGSGPRNRTQGGSRADPEARSLLAPAPPPAGGGDPRPPARSLRAARSEPHGHPIAELVRTILSQNTNDRNRDVAYARMRDRFPTWEQVRDAPPAEPRRRSARAG